MAQRIPKRLQWPRTIHVLEKIKNSLHAVLDFLNPPCLVAAPNQSQAKIQPCEIIVSVERQSLFQGLARFRITFGPVLCPAEIGPNVFAKIYRAIKVIGILRSNFLKVSQRRLRIVYQKSSSTGLKLPTDGESGASGEKKQKQNRRGTSNVSHMRKG